MHNVEVELSDEQFLIIAQEAHKQDITFNQLAVKLLQQYIDRHPLVGEPIKADK